MENDRLQTHWHRAQNSFVGTQDRVEAVLLDPTKTLRAHQARPELHGTQFAMSQGSRLSVQGESGNLIPRPGQVDVDSIIHWTLWT